ncbi:MAG: 6-bladed beta-propeller [Bacteroidales bacterium]|nr:6-bladed beta-propeller [Bacteroidales bacterium]
MYIFILINGCSDRRKYPVDSISANDSLFVVDVDSIQDTEVKYLSDFFHSVHTTILDDIPEALFGTFSKMAVIDSLLIVLDIGISNSVFVFDHKGNFIRKIGSIGKGPGEYLTVYDITYDPINRSLMLLDTWSQKINVYDLQTGIYTGSIRLKGDVDRLVRAYHIHYQDGVIYTDAYFDFPSPRNYLLRSFSDRGIQRTKHLRTEDYNKGWNNIDFVEKSVFSDFGGNEGVLFHQQFMDTIMMIQNNRIFPYAILKSKRFVTNDQIKQIYKNRRNRGNKIPFEDLYGMDVIWGISNIVLHKDFLFFRYHDGEYRGEQILYHKETGATSKVYLINDVLYKEEIQERVYQSYLCANSKGLYTYIDIDDFELLVNHARAGLLSLPSDQIEKIIQLNEKPNHVILYYEYKN